MKARYGQFYNVKTDQYEKWYLEVKQEGDRKYRLINAVFETENEAKQFFKTLIVKLEQGYSRLAEILCDLPPIGE